MPEKLSVLILEDNPSDAELITRNLSKGGFDPKCTVVRTKVEFVSHMTLPFDVILSDYRLPDFSGLEALHLLVSSGTETPFILVTGSLGDEKAVEAIKQGAFDYLIKDRMSRLGEAVKKALEHKKLQTQRKDAEEALRAKVRELEAVNKYFQQHLNEWETIVKSNEQLQRKLEQLNQVAGSLNSQTDLVLSMKAYSMPASLQGTHDN